MGFIARLFGGWAAKNATLELFRDIYGAPEVKSGQKVNWKTALEVTTVLRATQVIADGVATVPWKLYRKQGATRAEATDHPLHDLIHDQPNEWQDSLQFRETLAYHLVLCGNAFVFLNRVRGRVVEMLPLEPGRVRVTRGPAPDYRLSYEVTGEDGSRETFPAEAIWHLRGASWNGWMGLETVRLAREAIGLAMATEEAHARLHQRGVQASGAYAVEGTLNEDQYKRLRAHIEQNHAGARNAGKPMILDRAAKWLQLGMTGVDAQHLETRRFQIEEICRALGVMPIMVGYSDKAATYASAEQMFLAHAVHTVRPWHRRFEASARVNLLTPAERREGYYTKFLDTELLRGAAKDRGEYYARGISAGWLLRNEARAFEDMDEVEGLSEPLTPTNMTVGNPEPAAQGTDGGQDGAA